ncbi:MAG TPA: KR domain-containing protein, partial [Herpetosiphonaceae bacterium]
RLLHTSHAFHSAAMNAIIAPFAELMSSVRLSPPQIPYLSNLTGTWIDAAEVTDPRYWVRHLRETVRFAAGIAELAAQPEQIFLEVGPGQTLSSLARQQLGADSEHLVLTSLRHPQDQQPDRATLLRALGQLWLSGAPIAWASAHAQEQRRRLPLPTYPFERERYWIDGRTRDAAPVQHRRASGEWLYLPSWKRSVPPALPTPEILATNRRGWLIFLDAPGLGARLAQRLAAGDQHVITVTAGEHFARLGERSYMIRPRQRDDYRALLQALPTGDQPISNVVHLWSVTADDSDLPLEQRLSTGFNSLLLLAEAIAAQPGAQRIAITAVANHTQDLNGETTICPEKTTILALCNALPQAYPQLSCRSIDVALPAKLDQRADRLAATLLAEVVTPTRDLLIAYRGGNRWVRTFEPVTSDDAALQSRLRPDGVYLILGGLAGHGALLAGHLARTMQARLALIEPADATNPAQPDLGAQVLLAHADLGDLAAVRSAVDRIQEQLGPIQGIIDLSQTAAAPTQMLHELDAPAFERSVQDVARRLAVLDAIVQVTQPDFCLVLSSLDAVLPTADNLSSAALHLLIDAWAYRSGQSGAVPWLSVNWEAQPAEQPIEPDEALRVFQQIFALGPVPQIVVSTTDLNARIDDHISHAATEATATRTNARAYARPRLRSEYVAPGNEIERRLAGIWQQI